MISVHYEILLHFFINFGQTWKPLLFEMCESDTFLIASSSHVGMSAAGDRSAADDAMLRDGGDSWHWAAYETLCQTLK